MARKKTKPGAKPKRKPPPKMVIRRNTASPPMAPVALSVDGPRNARSGRTPPRPAIRSRVRQMSGSHVAAGIGAGTLGNAVGVLTVAKRWLGPKAAAGILMGTGTAAAAAGWFWDADHLMAAGTGIAAAGTFSMANQLAVDVYEAAEKKAAEKRAKRDEADREKAREVLAEEAAKRPQRNAPVFHVVMPSDDDGVIDGDGDGDDESDGDVDDIDDDVGGVAA